MQRCLLVFVALSMTTLFTLPAFAGGNVDKGTDLEPTRPYNQQMIRTALSANWHMKTASFKKKKKIRKRLKNAGWTLVDNDIIQPKGVKDGRAYVATRGNDVVIAFRGSKGDKWWKTASNAATDLNAIKEKPRWLKKHNKRVRVHKGFSNEYQRFRNKILPKAKKLKNKRIFVVGFSLGGALAQLCALDLALNAGASKVYAYPHGAPRVGEKDFRKMIERKVKRIDRVILDGDPVPRVPPRRLAYRHAGRLLLLDESGSRKTDHEQKNRMPYHNYDKYRSALKKHLKKCSKECKKGALMKAANKTR